MGKKLSTTIDQKTLKRVHGNQIKEFINILKESRSICPSLKEQNASTQFKVTLKSFCSLQRNIFLLL